MLKSLTKTIIYIISLAIVSIVGSMAINLAIAAWSEPSLAPPNGNINAVIFNGDAPTLATITSTGSNFNTTQTTNAKFYVDSNEGLQLRIDSNADDTNSEFTINNGANEEIFKIDENGIITAKSDYTPVSAQDLTTKSYVDAAGGGSHGSQIFTSSGTWTRPTDVTEVSLILIGGGGGGGGTEKTGAPTGGGGGGSGAYIHVSSYPVTSSSYTVTIGSNGTGGSNDGRNCGSCGDGTNGGSTSFDSLTVGAGSGGTRGQPNGVEGIGGSGGTISYTTSISSAIVLNGSPGGDGGDGSWQNSHLGLKGGNLDDIYPFGGVGGASVSGGGGGGGTVGGPDAYGESGGGSAPGSSGKGYGSGGGGGGGVGGVVGGAGSSGAVIISW